MFVFVIFGWLVSLCLHEFGHAYSAWRFGDRDVEARGYLTLNPLKYSHPLLSLGLPVLFIALGGIGLPGGAVYLQTGWMGKWQRTLISLAGPAANVVCAVLLLTATRLFYDPGHSVFWAGVAFLGFLQITAFLLNILPIPGLDGYGTRAAPQPADAARGGAGQAVGLSAARAPAVRAGCEPVVLLGVYALFELSGVPAYLSAVGGELTRFWSAWQ